MTKHEEKIFTYHEALPIRSISRLPEVLTFGNISYEALLFRLLMGTINISHNYENTLIRQRNNYSRLTEIKENKRLSALTVADCLVPLDQKESINTYFKRNRKNTDIFEQVLLEMTNYFYQKSKNSYTAAFVHLYRCIEFISYSFPLIYASKTQDYKGTYTSLKSFLGGDQKSELKFFRAFQKTLLGNSTLSLKLDIDIQSPSTEMKSAFAAIILELCRGNIESEVNDVITIHYENFFDFIINMRNRYFHFMIGTNMNNISTKEVEMEYLFKSVNEQVVNFIAVIYFEICKFGVESI